MKKIVILLFVVCAANVWQSCKAQVLESKPPLDNFYEKVNNVGQEPRPYVNVRHADVYYATRIWRTIDFREKMNQYFYYPTQPVQDRISFMTMVNRGLREGSIVPYDAITDDFTRPMTYEEFISANTNIQEKEVEDLNNPGEMIRRIDTTSFSPENVKMIRIKEDYFVDKQRSIRDIRILGICPLMQVFDDQTGEFRGTKPLFWLYYPDCRDLFVNTESFNRHNSAMRLSYDDVFAWKRFFNSYIIKIDNQQDRFVQEYATGQQIMIIAEQLKVQLLNVEQDLWEF
ncbi:gliding motility protein GldO [Bacteroidia bacterium]|nr:gliding motility protein GldO [Bacteroidia bacterium]